MKQKPFLSVTMSNFNEKENLERGVLDEMYRYLKAQKYQWEVIISDDGSTDNSVELIKESIINKPGFSIYQEKHGGKPHGIWCSIQRAQGEYVLFTDIDQSTPMSQLELFNRYFNHYDVIIGSRGTIRKNFGLLRKIGSVVFITIRKAILLPHIDDTQCGFKAMRREVALKLFPKLEFFNDKKPVKGWKVTSYDVEMLFLAEKNDCLIKEVPVKWADEDISTGKQRSYLKESKRMLMQILRVKLNDLKGVYEDSAK